MTTSPEAAHSGTLRPLPGKSLTFLNCYGSKRKINVATWRAGFLPQIPAFISLPIPPWPRGGLCHGLCDSQLRTLLICLKLEEADVTRGSEGTTGDPRPLCAFLWPAHMLWQLQLWIHLILRGVNSNSKASSSVLPYEGIRKAVENVAENSVSNLRACRVAPRSLPTCQKCLWVSRGLSRLSACAFEPSAFEASLVAQNTCGEGQIFVLNPLCTNIRKQ